MNYPAKGDIVILQTPSVAFLGILKDAYKGLIVLAPLKKTITTDYLLELEKNLGISPVIIEYDYHFIIPSPTSYILINLSSTHFNSTPTNQQTK